MLSQLNYGRHLSPCARQSVTPLTFIQAVLRSRQSLCDSYVKVESVLINPLKPSGKFMYHLL
jgi:hypothetical protein